MPLSMGMTYVMSTYTHVDCNVLGEIKRRLKWIRIERGFYEQGREDTCTDENPEPEGLDETVNGWSC